MSLPKADLFEAQIVAHLRMFRGQAVMLDSDLAWFLGIDPAKLIDAVETHPEAFPRDFVFRLTRQQSDELQKRAPCLTWGRQRTASERLAFTTHGSGMLLAVMKDGNFWHAATPVLRAFANYWKSAESNEVAPPLVNRNS